MSVDQLRSSSISTLSSARLARGAHATSLKRRRTRFRFPKLPRWMDALPFIGIHVAWLAVFVTSVHTIDWIMAVVALPRCGCSASPAGYHRYFAHRSYKTSRSFQFVLAWLGCSALQKGPLWWAAITAITTATPTAEDDPHSPVARRLLVVARRLDPLERARRRPRRAIRDFEQVPRAALARQLPLGAGDLRWPVLCWLIGGWSGLVWGFVVSTVAAVPRHVHDQLARATCSAAAATPRPTTAATTSAWRILTLGEGWHNNHHHYQSCARQGFFWWEIDISYYTLKAPSCVGLVWELREPPKCISAAASPCGRNAHAQVRNPRLASATHLNRSFTSGLTTNPSGHWPRLNWTIVCRRQRGHILTGLRVDPGRVRRQCHVVELRHRVVARAAPPRRRPARPRRSSSPCSASTGRPR